MYKDAFSFSENKISMLKIKSRFILTKARTQGFGYIANWNVYGGEEQIPLATIFVYIIYHQLTPDQYFDMLPH